MRLVYIASENRSGSTLLDLLLGGHSKTFGVGEIARLSQFYLDDETCTCGQTVTRCNLWSSVFQTLKENDFDFSQFETRVRNQRRRLPLPTLAELSLLHSRVAKLMTFLPPVRRSVAAAGQVWKVADILSEATGCDWIVDSSKRAEQLGALYVHRPEKIRVIHLVRDGRAVAYSMVNRTNNSFTRATRSWLMNTHLQLKLQKQIPESQRMFIRYEDLCHDPIATLESICEFLEIGYESDMLQPSIKDRHNIGGSPRKHDPGELKIKLDQRWLTGINETDARFFDRWAGRLNSQFGYPREIPTPPTETSS